MLLEHLHFLAQVAKLSHMHLGMPQSWLMQSNIYPIDCNLLSNMERAEHSAQHGLALGLLGFSRAWQGLAALSRAQQGLAWGLPGISRAWQGLAGLVRAQQG